jgi:hypothetical protein
MPAKNTFFGSLLAIQKEMTTVAKNKKAFKGTYADIEAVWEASRKIINENGFVVVHSIIPEGVKTEAVHESGEKIASVIPLSPNADSQELGKQITYARRYNLNAIFNIIVADEDNDADAKHASPDKAITKLKEAKDVLELTKIFKTLSVAEQNDSRVIQAGKDRKKEIMEEIPTIQQSE